MKAVLPTGSERVVSTGITSFKGVPFAAPPIGPLRWQAPLPPWHGVGEALHLGPRPMQLSVFDDMNFRSERASEACLYLNVWPPEPSDGARLPVLVYFCGGGFLAGDSSEPRYDGEQMARRGIVTCPVSAGETTR